MKHLVQFSTGLSSAEVAWRLTEKHGADAVVLMSADTLREDPDNWRFAREVVARLGCEWIKLTDGRTPMQAGRDAKCVPNNRMAVCSQVLKREPLRHYMDANYDPAADVVYIGYDWSEPHRIANSRQFWAPWTMVALLAEPPYAPPLEDLFRSRGIEPPSLYQYNYGHANCLHPDTRFITDQGIRTLRECLGKSVRILGGNAGWRDAEVHSFGEQDLWEIRLRRYGDEQTILATPGHLWPVRKQAGRTTWGLKATSELKAGYRIAGMYGRVGSAVRPSPIGVAAGFTFGDGDACTYSSGQNPPARAHLCGDKDTALLPYFTTCRVTREPGKVTVHDLPRSWKRHPDLSESQSYLYGWLAGYFAADGTVTGNQARIASSTLANLEFVRDLCARLGIGANPVRREMRVGYGSEPTALYTVSLHPGTLRPDFFVIPEHRRRFESRPGRTPRPSDWQVVSVSPTGCREEVMCAVVPEGHMFTLDGNIYTHNCGGCCVRGGQASWAKTLRVFPERYQDWEREEEQTRAELGKDVAILRDRSKTATAADGRLKPLPLRVFRQRLQQQGSLFDQNDHGACGCDMDSGALPSLAPPRPPKVERWDGAQWVTLPMTFPSRRPQAMTGGEAA